jgi:hypothetical protein
MPPFASNCHAQSAQSAMRSNRITLPSRDRSKSRMMISGASSLICLSAPRTTEPPDPVLAIVGNNML